MLLYIDYHLINSKTPHKKTRRVKSIKISRRAPAGARSERPRGGKNVEPANAEREAEKT